MSSPTGDNNSISTCAACGTAGDSLKACTSCKQVKYCNRECQKLHWPQHKKECKQLADSSNMNIDNISESIDNINLSDSISASSTAEDKKMNISYEEKQKMVHVKKQSSINISNDELYSDDKLFREPPAKEECPLCLIPMPFSQPGACGVTMTYQMCCGKMVCDGCVTAAGEEMKKGNMKWSCPFCRVALPHSDKEQLKRCKKRIKLNCPEAFFKLGCAYSVGGWGLAKDIDKTFDLWERAAELGSLNAYSQLGNSISKAGNSEKAISLLQLAAIGGHEEARHNLGDAESCNGNIDRAMKHYIIAAKSGWDESLKKVGKGYKAGNVTKDEYTGALRAYQETKDDMKSDQRSKAAVIQQARSLAFVESGGKFPATGSGVIIPDY